MPSAVIQVKYDQLQLVKTTFIDNGDVAKRIYSALCAEVDALQRGGWIGDNAQVFFASLNQEVLPGITRLGAALYDAAAVTQKVIDLFRAAEDQAGQLLPTSADQGGTGGGTGGGSATDPDFLTALLGNSSLGLSWLKSAGEFLSSAQDMAWLTKNLPKLAEFLNDSSFVGKLLKRGSDLIPSPVTIALSWIADTAQLHALGRDWADAAGIAALKQGIEKVVFDTTPIGKGVELVNDGTQIVGKLTVGAANLITDHLNVSDTLRGNIQNANKDLSDTVDGLDLKNITRDLSATIYDGVGAIIHHGDQANMDRLGTSAHDLLNSTGGFVSSALLIGDKLDHDLGAVGTGVVVSVIDSSPMFDQNFKNSVDQAASQTIQLMNSMPVTPTGLLVDVGKGIGQILGISK